MSTRAVASIVALLLTGPALAAAQTPAQRFRLASSTLQLAAGETGGTLGVTVIATLTEQELAPRRTATLVDETPNATGVRVTAPPIRTTNDLQQIWRFEVTVQNFPKAESQNRVFLLSYGGFREPLTYTLSNIASKTFGWSVKAAPEWNLGSMTALSIALRIGDVAATNVALQDVMLAGEDKQKRTLGMEHFMLCQNASGDCRAAPASLAPREPYTLYVRPTGALPAGTFKGNVLIAAKEKADPEVLPLTMYSPDPNAIAWGLGALIVGVLFSLVVQVLARSVIQNRQDKAAIALLRKRLQEIVADFETLPADLKTAAQDWKDRAAALDTEITGLKDSVRGVVQSPFADEITSIETLKAGLERLAKDVLLLRTLLRDGLEAVAAILRQFPAVAADAKTAAQQIAEISAAEDAATRINAILTALRGRAGVTARMGMTGAPGKAAATLQSLRLQVVAISLIVWAIWGAVSVLSGALVLIYQNPGFGTTFDVLTCLAWGLGVSIAGQSASQLTPASVAQSVGVKLPAAK